MKFKKRRLKSFIALLLVATMTLSPIANIKAETAEVVTSKSDSEANHKFIGDGFEVDFNVDSQGDGAFNGDITVKNTGNIPIENWYIMFDMQNEISNIWNASIETYESGTYVIKNAGWNQDIPVGGTVNFGFNGVGNEIFYPTSYDIPTANQNVNNESYKIDYLLNSDWGTGFSSTITIGNNSDNVIEDWTLELDFDKTITNIWNGVILEHTGNHYVIKNASYNQNIAVGGAIYIGFNGQDGNAVNMPENYILSEYTLENTKYVQLGDGKIDADYLYKAIYPNLFSRGLNTDNILLSDDYDNDDLTLEEEYMLDTNPFVADTDEDGINDYDEVTVYKTNPLKWDTDADCMSDGTEISAGLNPLIADTDGDGIIDSGEVVTQNVRIESIEQIDINETLVKPDVEITGKGDFSNQLYIEDINDNTAISGLDYIVGHPFEFVHEDNLEFESSTLSFAIDPSVLQDNNFEDMAIAFYDMENNEVQILDTKHDANSNIISAEVEHYSTYFVVNLRTYYSAIPENIGKSMKDGKADIVFLVNTQFYMDDTIDNIKSNLTQFVDDVEANNVDAQFGLVEFNGLYMQIPEQDRTYNWIPNTDICKSKISNLRAYGIYEDYDENDIGFPDALKSIRNMSFRSDANKYVIMITDAEILLSKAGETNIDPSDEDIPIQSSEELCFSTIAYFEGNSPYESLVSATNGVNGNIRANFSVNLKALISGTSGSVKTGFNIKLSNGSVVRLDKDPSLGDESVDTDKDGIPDIIELKSLYDISTYNPYTKATGEIETWGFNSNPVKSDTDGDGLSDIEDLRPCAFDTRIINSTDTSVEFNTGRTWYNVTCTSYKYLTYIGECFMDSKKKCMTGTEGLAIEDIISKNLKQNFNIDELECIGLINNEGSKFYLDNKSSATRERIFSALSNRESKYYQSTSELWSSEWIVVPSTKAGGFFNGKILSEADINFSLKMFYVIDVYDVLTVLASCGAAVIAAFMVVEVSTAVIANASMLTYYIQNYGVKNGLSCFYYLGNSGMPDGVISVLQKDLSDGDSEMDDIAAYVVTDLSDGDTVFDDVVCYANTESSKEDTPLDEVVLGTYNNLKKIYKGTDIQCHHLIEKRLISAFKDCAPTLTEGQFLSTPFNRQAHQVFTNLFRNYLPYGEEYTIDEVVEATQKVYKDYPTLLNAANEWLKSKGAK